VLELLESGAVAAEQGRQVNRRSVAEGERVVAEPAVEPRPLEIRPTLLIPDAERRAERDALRVIAKNM